jgi:hypothetical protein
MAMWRQRRFIDSYLQGGTEEYVWWLLSCEGELREGEPVWDDAYSVARATMARVRTNVEIIIEYLNHVGYVFGYVGESREDKEPPWRLLTCPPKTDPV